MLQAHINEDIIKDGDVDYLQQRTSSFGSNEAVVILNPTEYTLNEEEEEFDEESSLQPQLNSNI